MTPKHINTVRPACYGMGCPHHHECQRYAAVEDTSPDHTMATCDDGDGGRPHFQPLPVEVIKEHA